MAYYGRAPEKILRATTEFVAEYYGMLRTVGRKLSPCHGRPKRVKTLPRNPQVDGPKPPEKKNRGCASLACTGPADRCPWARRVPHPETGKLAAEPAT